MVKLLIGITSCHKDRNTGCHEVIRRTWGRIATALGIDVRFFVGGEKPAAMADDEVHVEVPDDYYSLPHKTKAVAGWFLEHDYTHLYKCDNDTFVHPQRLLSSDFAEADYYGEPVDPVYFNGGPGYSISRKAAEILVASEVGDDVNEDHWVGSMLHGKDIIKRNGGSGLWRYCAWHYPVGAYGNRRYHPDSKWQETMARAYLGIGEAGLDPRGLCFQDRTENGLRDGEYKILLIWPGHPDRVVTVSKKELDYWQGHHLVRRIISPRW